jgi:hypothetical protein
MLDCTTSGRGGFDQFALSDTIDILIEDHNFKLYTKKLWAKQINAYLDKARLSLDGNNFTYAYQ